MNEKTRSSRIRFAVHAGALLLGVGLSWAAVAQSADIVIDGEKAAASLDTYRADLDAFRNEFGGSRDMPEVPFFQFGMGRRTKYVYKPGLLVRAADGRVFRRWDHTQTSLPTPRRSS